MRDAHRPIFANGRIVVLVLLFELFTYGGSFMELSCILLHYCKVFVIDKGSMLAILNVIKS